MRVITSYKCEKCGRTYDTEEDAMRCENGHAKPVSIRNISNAYRYDNNLKSGYPVWIEVNMDSGAVVRYSNPEELYKTPPGFFAL